MTGAALPVLKLLPVNIIMTVTAVVGLDIFELTGTGLFLCIEFYIGKFASRMTFFTPHVLVLALKLVSFVSLIVMPEGIFPPVIFYRMAGITPLPLELSLMNIIMTVTAVP